MNKLEDLYFRQIQIGPMANFVYLIGSNSTKEATIVDPAWDVKKLLKIAEDDGMTINHVLVTHTHADHIGGKLMNYDIEGIAELMGIRKVKVHVHKSEATRLKLPDSEIVRTEENSNLNLGGISIGFIHTPGHSPGSQCFKIADHLVTGDTLFIGSAGRTDLDGSNPGDLFSSLTEKLMGLDDSTLVFPGHNYSEKATHSSIEIEKATNPFLRFPSKSAFLAAMG